MGVLIVAGISVGAIAFMTVFLIALCRESGRMKVYRIISATYIDDYCRKLARRFRRAKVN
jgi:hypothetical protein